MNECAEEAESWEMELFVCHELKRLFIKFLAIPADEEESLLYHLIYENLCNAVVLCLREGKSRMKSAGWFT